MNTAKEDDMIYIPHQIDHIIRLRQGGKTEIENLAYNCFSCNNNKGSDIETILLPQKLFVRLFNPRIDSWIENFESINGVFHSLTPIGEATVKLIKLNSKEKIIEHNV